MKGGKEGRKRKTSGSGAASQGSVRGKPQKGGAKRPPGSAPKKGSRKKSFGGRPTSGDE